LGVGVYGASASEEGARGALAPRALGNDHAENPDDADSALDSFFRPVYLYISESSEKREETVVAGSNYVSERIRIRMEAYDHEVLDRTALEIVRTAQDTKAIVHGPIPLPTRIERYTVLRSPHIDRKSREQFEIRTHKRLIDILQPTGKTIEALNKGLSLPPGVEIKIRVLHAPSAG
jgi:small subunit ribosomal protein S10